MLTSTVFCAVVLAAGTPDWASHLLPRPREVVMREGAFDPGAATAWNLAVPPDVSGARIRARITEAVGCDTLNDTPSDAGRFALTGGVPEPGPVPELPDEGYALDITPDGVRVAAVSERGLYYGALTLGQVMEAVRDAGLDALPCLTIRDWPAIPMRGPHEDFGRDQLPTMDDLKRGIRTAAAFKMNTYLWFIEPDHFVYAFDPDISTDYDRFSFDEIRELVAYARGYYVDIIPVVELLAHMEMTLRHERYQGLSETGQGGGTLCPTSDASFALVEKMVNEIAPAFDGAYFHCGLDESQAVGQGRSADAVREKGLERVYADYYTRMNDLVRSHGKTMIMYADIVLNRPGILDMLPRDMVMMFWEYQPLERYEGLDKLVALGFPVMALSGMWDWCNLYPVYPPGMRNMDALARQSAELGILGHFVSDWGDGYRGAAGTNLSELSAYGYVYAGVVSWNTDPIAMDAYSEAFARHYFGCADPALAEALTRLGRCQGLDLRWNTRARRVLHDDLMHTATAMMGADEATVAFWRNLRTEAEASGGLLAGVKARRNADYLDAVTLAADMLVCAADMALVGHDMTGGPARDALPRLRELEARHRALWTRYRATWLATNRPLNLVHIGKAWNAASDEIGALADAVDAGAFPPSIEEGDRLVFDFDGVGNAAWRSTLGEGVTLKPAEGPAPLLLSGGPSGSGQFLRLPHGARLEGDDTGRAADFGVAPLLVEAWVRHRGQTEQQYGATVFSFGLGGGFRLGINHRGETLFTLYGIGEAVCTQSVVPPDGQWHHLAVNFHGGQHVDTYVDGKLTERQTLVGFPRSPGTPLIRIGNEIGLVTPFEGDLDRIRVRCGIYEAPDLDARP